MKKNTERIALRLPSEEKLKILQLVNEGRFGTLSQVVRVALRDFLKNAWRDIQS